MDSIRSHEATRTCPKCGVRTCALVGDGYGETYRCMSCHFDAGRFFENTPGEGPSKTKLPASPDAGGGPKDLHFAYEGRGLVAAFEAENTILRSLICEITDGDWTDAAYALELPSRLTESGWFKRARAALT